MRVSREFKLGILMVLGMLLFLITFNFLKGYGTFGKPREFLVEFDQAYGLKVDDEVQVNGVKVGQVSHVDLFEDDANRVIVQFEIIEDELEIPKESELWLISSDILGTKVLDLRVPHDTLLSADYELYKDGDMFDPDYVRVAKGFDSELEALFLPIKDKTEQLVSNVEDIIVKVISFWDSSAAYTFDASMTSTRDAIEQYKEMTNNVTNLVQMESQHIAVVKTGFNEINQFYKDRTNLIAGISRDVSQIQDRFTDPELSNAFSETSSRFSKLKHSMSEMNLGKGSLGKFMHTSELSEHIAAIDSSVTSLVDHLQARPKDFYKFSIFGLKAEGYQPDKAKEKHLDGVLDSLHDGKKVTYK